MDGTFKVSQSRPTVYNTTEDRFFDFWTDGHTVAAILYVQESYDTYDWDAEVNVKGVNKHYLNVAPDGSWTLRWFAVSAAGLLRFKSIELNLQLN